MTTVLEWAPPGIELPEQPTEGEHIPFNLSDFVPDEDELEAWKENPQLAKLFDKILCSAARQGFEVPAQS
jgi:hypothetical protein